MKKYFAYSIILIIFASRLKVCYANNIHFQNNPRSGQSSQKAALSLTQNVEVFIMENSQLQMDFTSVEEEIWKDVVGYVYPYQVSSLGNLKALSKKLYANGKGTRNREYPEKILTPIIGLNGYKKTSFYISKGKNKTVNVHRLVAEAFIPNPDNKPCVNHKNGIKTDNRAVNLEWCTYLENSKHAVLNDLIPFGENSFPSKLTEKQIVEIREKYKPRIYTTYMLGDEYGVSSSLISAIVLRKTWKKV